MNGKDLPPEPTGIDEDEALDPGTAAALFEKSTKEAQRQFDIRPPLLILLAAVTVLVCYGVIWWSVRDQHPYTGPSHTALAVLYTTLFALIIVVAVISRRAIRGVGGHSSQQRRAAGVTFTTIWIMVYVFAGALDHTGVSPAIKYGIYPAAAPLIIVGSAAAAYALAQDDRGWSAFALAAVALGALASYAGPANVWGVIGMGLCLLLLTRAATRIWQFRRPAWMRRPGWARTAIH
jgi:hypothetical protein